MAREWNTAEDGFLTPFDGPQQAIRCAMGHSRSKLVPRLRPNVSLADSVGGADNACAIGPRGVHSAGRWRRWRSPRASYRKGLSGPELADALGVTPRNANVLVERLRDTIARSLGVLLVCRQVRTNPNNCPELAELIAHWDGQFTVLMRKRAARHIDSCAVCEQQRAKMITPAALLGATPLLIPAPDWLREHTLSQGTRFASWAIDCPQ